jgi:hypothetical protein
VLVERVEAVVGLDDVGGGVHLAQQLLSVNRPLSKVTELIHQ